MTINIAVVTSEAVVLGCDSISSITVPVVNPFQFIEIGDAGIKTDTDGRYVIHVPPTAIRETVTRFWSGAKKMFKIHGDLAHVAAVTSGMAMLKNKNIAALADQFLLGGAVAGARTVEEVARSFHAYIRVLYTDHHKEYSSQMPQEFWPDLEFLLGGYGQGDQFPSVWRLNIRPDTCERVYPEGEFGVCWGGQADAIQRFFLGYDLNPFGFIPRSLLRNRWAPRSKFLP